MTVSLEKLEDHFKNKGKQKEQTQNKKQVVECTESSDDEIEIVKKPKTRVTLDNVTDDEKEPSWHKLPYRNMKAIIFKPLPVDSQLRFEDLPKKVQNPLENDKTPVYKNVLPIHKDGRAQEVTSRVLEAPISIDAKELLDLSPAVRKELAKLMAKKCVATKPVVQSAYSVRETHLYSAPLLFSLGDLDLEKERACALKFDAIKVSELLPAQLTVSQFMAADLLSM